MPRKSTSSMAAGETSNAMPLDGPAEGEVNVDGESSILSAGTDTANPKPKSGGKKDKEDQENFGVEDLLLPRTLTSRLAKGILPANTSIQKDALLALTKAATVFISYLASTANEQTQKKTVGPQDVLKAIHEIELSSVMELTGTETKGAEKSGGGRLERELALYEDVIRGKRKGYRDKMKARESGATATEAADGKGSGGEDEEIERGSKRARIAADQDHEMPDTEDTPPSRDRTQQKRASSSGRKPSSANNLSSKNPPPDAGDDTLSEDEPDDAPEPEAEDDSPSDDEEEDQDPENDSEDEDEDNEPRLRGADDEDDEEEEEDLGPENQLRQGLYERTGDGEDEERDEEDSD